MDLFKKMLRHHMRGCGCITCRSRGDKGTDKKIYRRIARRIVKKETDKEITNMEEDR